MLAAFCLLCVENFAECGIICYEDPLSTEAIVVKNDTNVLQSATTCKAVVCHVIFYWDLCLH